MSINPSRDPRMGRVNVSSLSGPAQMATRQDEFRKELERRYRNLRGAVRKTIVDNDALGLIEAEEDGVDLQELVNIDPADNFPTGSRKRAFEEWFEEAVEAGILEPLDREDVIAGRHYTAPYAESSYEDGLSWADKQLKDAGFTVGETDFDVIAQLPRHEDALETIYSRHYSQLETAIAGTESEMTRIMADEFARGSGPEKMAKELTDSIRGMQRTDARRIARSETMNAHAQATGERLKEFGVEEVHILNTTACDRCQDFIDQAPMPIEEAQAGLPVHPNCVCAMVL